MKYAILCGIDYNTTNTTLSSSNNVANIMNFLVGKCDYYSNNITIVSDCGSLSKTHPTKIRIMNSMYYTINKCKPGDTLFFYYAGHSSLEKVRNNVFDNIIVPTDYKSEGHMQNDALYKILIQDLPDGITLYAFFDCCQSDRMFDLPYHIESKLIYEPKKIQCTYIDEQDEQTDVEEKEEPHIPEIYSFLQFEEELPSETTVEPVEEELPSELPVEPVEEELPSELPVEPVEEELPSELPVEPVEEELPSKYNDDDWSNEFTINSGKYIRKNNKIYIFSSYVDKKYLYNNCKNSHGDFTNCFIEFVNDNCTINNNGILKFDHKNMLHILKQISCRLHIRKSLQKVKLSVINSNDIHDIL